MMYMPDVLKATLGLMHADQESLSTSMSYNISGFSLTPKELFEEIKQYIPELTINYIPDSRQKIADSWSETIDDGMAREDWNWMPSFDMKSMVLDMIEKMKD